MSDAVGKVQEVATRAVAAAKGPLHMVRGTGEAEKMLKNAKTEYSEEHEEIATYNGHRGARGERRRQGDRQSRARGSAKRRSAWRASSSGR